MNGEKNRRRHNLVNAILHVEYGKHAYAMESARTKDASPGGLFILTKNPLMKGFKILVHLFITDADGPIEADCEVVWTRPKGTQDKPAGMGVRFVDIDQRELETLNIFLSGLGG